MDMKLIFYVVPVLLAATHFNVILASGGGAVARRLGNSGALTKGVLNRTVKAMANAKDGIFDIKNTMSKGSVDSGSDAHRLVHVCFERKKRAFGVETLITLVEHNPALKEQVKNNAAEYFQLAGKVYDDTQGQKTDRENEIIRGLNEAFDKLLSANQESKGASISASDFVSIPPPDANLDIKFSVVSR